MSSALILLSLISLIIICASTQYQYPYNYGYPVNTNSGYRSPCQSPCGNVRPRTPCPYSPCSSQYQQPQYQQPQYQQPQYQQQYPSYYPYPYYDNNNYANGEISYGQGYNPYNFLSSNSRTRWSPSSQSSDPYANVPVEIIDDDNVPRKGTNTLPNGDTKDPYANVPVEIIDDEATTGTPEFWSKIPRLPKVIKSSSSNYTVSQGAVTSDTYTENKPIRAVITRNFQPVKKNPIINIDFFNGEQTVDKKETEKSDETTTQTDAPTTESEDVAAVKSWF